MIIYLVGDNEANWSNVDSAGLLEPVIGVCWLRSKSEFVSVSDWGS